MAKIDLVKELELELPEVRPPILLAAARTPSSAPCALRSAALSPADASSG